MKRIEIDFAIDIELTDNEMQELDRLVNEIARRTAPEGCAHWLMSVGSKPMWSDADVAAFGDLPGGRSGQARGEPEFDDSILHLATAFRDDRGRTGREPQEES